MILNGYCTLAELKAELQIDAADISDDAELESAIEDASRAIDGEADRVFYQTDDSRAFAPAGARRVFCDDLVSVTAIGLADPAGTIPTPWQPSGYRLAPLNAASSGRPFLWIEPATDLASADLVLVDGLWGWPAIPEPIHRATLIEAMRLFRRRDAVFGITGNPEFTPMRVPAIDPDVRRLVRPFRRKDLA